MCGPQGVPLTLQELSVINLVLQSSLMVFAEAHPVVITHEGQCGYNAGPSGGGGKAGGPGACLRHS